MIECNKVYRNEQYYYSLKPTGVLFDGLVSATPKFNPKSGRKRALFWLVTHSLQRVRDKLNKRPHKRFADL